jgi:catechol 2,3-dioxygenase-like lactoylglutathione lyase family enzyme
LLAGVLRMRLCQIALSTTHLLRSHDWYRRALGLLAAGELRHREVPGRAKVSGLPESAFDVWCLVDGQEGFQFEMFEFQRPRMRTLPGDWRPSDIGYTTIGMHVGDFDEALARLSRTSGRPCTAPIGAPGRRRVCLRDPDGILLELMEDDVRAPDARLRPGLAVPVAVRFVTLSVADLKRARRFWIDALGLHEAEGIVLHTPEHEALWGLDGAKREALVCGAGDLLIEIVQYDAPVARARPAGHLLSDQGILNVAVGFEDDASFDAAYRRLLSLGYASNGEPWTLDGIAKVVYVNDDQGFSVELLHVEPAGLEYMGFLPAAGGV